METKKRHGIISARFVVGMMAVNCYVLADPETLDACVIDPGGEPDKIKAYLAKRGLNLKFIINTHGHGDHIAANGAFGKPIYIHRLEKDFLTDPDKNLSRAFFFSIRSPAASRLLEDKDIVELGSLRLKILHTPGHTPGSISIHVQNTVFTGDALFKGGIGRTDFEYGDEMLLLSSIKERLMKIGDDTVVCPGHGDTSTIGEERSRNQFLA